MQANPDWSFQAEFLNEHPVREDLQRTRVHFVFRMSGMHSERLVILGLPVIPATDIRKSSLITRRIWWGRFWRRWVWRFHKTNLVNKKKEERIAEDADERHSLRLSSFSGNYAGQRERHAIAQSGFSSLVEVVIVMLW